MSIVTPGIRLRLRGEDFLVTNCEKDIVFVDGISELVYGQRFQFDLRLENYDIVEPSQTQLQPDTSPNYRQTKLFLETVFRNSSHYSEGIEIANKAAIRAANYQLIPTIQALSLPKPRLLIADAVGLGKTVQVGIFMAELIRRGKGKKILVVTPKSILAQFQQEIWSRFAIPLVRIDTRGIANIRANIPTNKNPFDYYDKVIVSVDTLKNNGKYRLNLEKVQWDIVAIDECHTVANIKSERGKLAQLLSKKTEALVLTSATPHNGKKENFANLISLLDPTAIPYNGDFSKEDIQSLFVRRFKKDVEEEVGDAFSDRETIRIAYQFNDQEEEALRLIQNFKKRAFEESGGDLTYGVLLFSVGLFKAFMSSPKACLETINRRLEKNKDEESVAEVLLDLKETILQLLKEQADSKYNKLISRLRTSKWSGVTKDERIIIFSERRDTLNFLEKNLKKEFNLSDNSVVQFNGSLTDTKQQEILDNFSKKDSKIRLFLASDAGSQGVNLHYHCNKMYNYDIPWSIITLDQRNGRIDRFGQEKTPYIYYLIGESSSDDVQGDIRILEKLKEKEEEVYNSLGDAGNVWKLFDADKEESKVTEAIATSDVHKLDEDRVQNNSDDWLDDVFGTSSEETEKEKTPISIDEGFQSFYADDFGYYATLIEELLAREDRLRDQFNIETNDKVIEVVQNKDLSQDGVLYDVPAEAFPKKKDTFKLTTEQSIVEEAIVRARRKQNTWPSHHLLYDLHPIAKWMQHKLLGRVDRGNALLVRMRNPLPPGSAWFVFQGITSNGHGRPIFSKSFVVGKSFGGESIGNLESFSEFMDDNRLKDTIPTLEVAQEHIDTIKSLLGQAVESAKNMYKLKLQGDLEDEMEEKLEIYEQKLNKWLQASETQLELKFGEEETGVLSYHKRRRRKEVNYVKEQMERFYHEFFQLENKPFLRLLAVFFNA